jgi:hypothetical protein
MLAQECFAQRRGATALLLFMWPENFANPIILAFVTLFCSCFHISSSSLQEKPALYVLTKFSMDFPQKGRFAPSLRLARVGVGGRKKQAWVCCNYYLPRRFALSQ